MRSLNCFFCGSADLSVAYDDFRLTAHLECYKCKAKFSHVDVIVDELDAVAHAIARAYTDEKKARAGAALLEDS